jgi:predicted nucleic acid-binding protein
MYLLDTNLLLELLLNQTKASQVTTLLLTVPARNLYLTEFSLYSMNFAF